MSYTSHESLTEIMNTLRMNLPKLKARLHPERDVEILHGHVEMLSCLLERYDRGELIETLTRPALPKTSTPQPIPTPR